MIDQAALMRELLQHGARARATIIRVDPPAHPSPDAPGRHLITFRFEPVAGGDPHIGTRELTVPADVSPEPGEVWFGWFMAKHPQTFGVLPPTYAPAELVVLYRQFGMKVPEDVAAAAAATTPEQLRTQQLAELDEALKLGRITQAEYQAQAKRIGAETGGSGVSG